MAVDEPKSKRPSNSRFKQQNLPAWRPILTPKAVIITFFLVGAVFIPIGAVVLVASNSVVEFKSDNYDGKLDDGGCCIKNCDSSRSGDRVDRNPCTLNITIDKKMKKPVYLYYKLTNYYQNHRRYVKSRDDPQLRGGSGLRPDDVEVGCEHRFKNSDNATGNAVLDVVSPCGLIAWSLFNDTIKMASSNGEALDVKMDDGREKDIAWATDVEKKFKNADDGSTGLNYPPFAYHKHKLCADLDTASQVEDCDKADLKAQKKGAGKDLAPRDNNSPSPYVHIGSSTGENYIRPGWCYKGSGYCTEDEHFIVWLRTAGLPSFRKLYAIIDQDLDKGDYSLTIQNGELMGGGSTPTNPHTGAAQDSLYPVKNFDGEKYVVLSTTSWIGGKNAFLGFSYIVVGVICVVLAIAFLVKDRLSPRDPSNASYMNHK